MAQLVWDKVGEKLYETGTDHGVLYRFDKATQKYGNAVVWNGLTGVTSSPSGAEPSPIYADNIKYANPLSAEEYGGTIEAYTYPDEFAACDGSLSINGVSVGQQNREQFAFSWRTKIGNDIDGDNHGYRLHVAYGCLAQPSESSFTTINDSPEAITLSWTFTTTPVPPPDTVPPAIKSKLGDRILKPTAYVKIDSTTTTAAALKKIEEALYNPEAELPGPWELLAMASENTAASSKPTLPAPQN